MVLLSLISLLGITALIHRKLHVTPASALLFAISAMLLTLYAGGLVGLLWWSAVGLHLAGALIAAALLLQQVRRGDRPGIPVSTGVFLVILALFWSVHHGSQFYFYDEYSHWGIFLKDVLAYDRFWGAESNTMQPRYVPGPTLWQYFFSVLAPQRTDSIAYMGQFVLLIAPLMILWEDLRWKQAGWILGIFAVCLAGLANFSPGVASLYVDHLLSTWFIGTLLCFLRDSDTRLARTLWFALPLATLALMKEAGLAFALAAAGIMAALFLRSVWRERHSAVTSAVRAFVIFLALAIPAVAAFQTWQLNRDMAGVEESRSSASGVVAALVEDNGDNEALRSEISRRFLEILLGQQLSKNEVSWEFNAFSYPLRELYTDKFRLTMISLLGIFVFWQLLLINSLIQGEDRWRWSILTTGLLVTTVGYIAMLYVNYTATLGEYGLALSSSLRYFHTIVLAMFIAAFAPLVPGFRPNGAVPGFAAFGRPLSWAATIFAAALIIFVVLERPYVEPLASENRRIVLREQTADVTSAISELAGYEEVWVFLPNDQPNEFIGRFLQFQLSPTPASIERSANFLEQSATDMLNDWAGYRILWFPNGTPEVLLENALIEEPSPTGIYRISGESAPLRLEPIQVMEDSETPS
jgi:hypothetical protein